MIREGVRYVRNRPDLLLVLGIVGFTGTFGLNFQMTSALMATEVYDKGPTEYGLLGTFMAVGSLSGALLAARREGVRHRLIVVAALAFGAVEIAAGLMPSYLTFALLTPLLGIIALTMITSANTFVQMHTEPGMRGRVMALYMMIFMGGTPLGVAVRGLGRGDPRGPLDAHPRWRADDPRGGGVRSPVRRRLSPACPPWRAARAAGPATTGRAAGGRRRRAASSIPPTGQAPEAAVEVRPTYDRVVLATREQVAQPVDRVVRQPGREDPVEG